MRKIFITIALATAVILSGSLYAQNQSAQASQNEKAKTEKMGKKQSKSKKEDKRYKGDKRMFNPFDGVQLTEDQMKRLQVLQQGLGPVILDKGQQKKVYGDSVKPKLSDEQKRQMRQEKKAKKLEAKKNYLNGVKEILTPEQYVMFLENVYLYSPQSQKEGATIKGKSAMPKNDKKKGKRSK